MKTKKIFLSAVAALMLGFGSCGREASIEMQLPSRFEGKDAELIGFMDSTVMMTGRVSDGRVRFEGIDAEAPVLTQIMIDGRVRAFCVVEPGKAVMTDSLSVSTGTELNDTFSRLMAGLDSVENLDDIDAYIRYAERCYNDNKDNILGDYFGVEVIRYADPAKTDSLLASASERFRTSRRTGYYARQSELRKNTAPGSRYADLEGETADGKRARLSDYVEPGRYTLVDFWASWCPYCVKEIPALKELKEKWGEKGLDIVGVAVRDKSEDTSAAISRHGIDWPVVFNTQRRPYDVYGFTGIPHHMLIGPDGTIIARGESAAQTETRLKTLLGE